MSLTGLLSGKTVKKLIINGGWFNKKTDALYRAGIKGLYFLNSLDDLSGFLFKGKDYFIIISYDLSGTFLELEIKRSSLPPLVLVEIDCLEDIIPVTSPCSLSLLHMSLDDDAYKKNVMKIRELIANGTIYQVNLTSRFDFEFQGEPESLFYRFHFNQPVPYSFYLHTGEFYILSGSMELFIEKKDRTILSKPIKGTATSALALMESEKDRAENLMITDMMRNDLGRIAEKGSVRVKELFKITEYRTLFQMHSTVEAITDRDFIDIVRETFPPASVTGAPKRKAVEIIESLEPHPRSYYCGTAGILRANGDFILSVLIRTAIGRGDKVSYYAGCGIVWDSQPEKELSELYLKVKAFSEENPLFLKPCFSENVIYSS